MESITKRNEREKLENQWKYSKRMMWLSMIIVVIQTLILYSIYQILLNIERLLA